MYWHCSSTFTHFQQVFSILDLQTVRMCAITTWLDHCTFVGCGEWFAMLVHAMCALCVHIR